MIMKFPDMMSPWLSLRMHLIALMPCVRKTNYWCMR